MAAKRKVDYEAIEPGWRAGLKSPAQLATEYTDATGISVSRSAIIKHFERLGVPRDLTAKVQAKAEAMVAEAMVTGKVSSVTTLTDSVIINAAALDVATIRVSHRTDIARTRNLSMALLAELEAQTGNMPGLIELGQMLRDPSETGADRLNDIYRAVIALPERSKTMKALTESLKSLIGLEREAYGLASADDKPPPPDPFAGMSDSEVARRIAFALHKGLTQKEQT